MQHGGEGLGAPGAKRGRASAKLNQSISEVFEIFNVRDRQAIDVADVTVALRMLGVGLTRESFRKDVLPRYAHGIPASNTVSQPLFTSIYLDLLEADGCEDDIDGLFASVDAERSGTLSLKTLQAINADLVALGLEDREYTTEHLESMLTGAFGADQVTPGVVRRFMQVT